jgi:hypothetical protein
MKKAIAVLVVLTAAAAAAAATAHADATLSASAKPTQELNINAFRSPSIGLEYRRGAFAVHGGAYPTVISKDAMGVYETSWFARAGLTFHFLPTSWYGQRPSEFFVSASYLRGLNLDHGNAAIVDLGYRWMIWRGLNVRLGVAVLAERNHDVKINPTPGLGWSTSW